MSEGVKWDVKAHIAEAERIVSAVDKPNELWVEWISPINCEWSGVRLEWSEGKYRPAAAEQIVSGVLWDVNSIGEQKK